MKIDEIIKKSIEIPGISIKRGEFSAELILKERDGKGSMTFFPLFPGVTLAYIFVNSPAWTAPDFTDNGLHGNRTFALKLLCNRTMRTHPE